MKNQVKHKYVPCEVNVAQFQTERGFAASNYSFTNTYNTWEMTNDNGSYKNEQYVRQDILDWSNDHNALKQ